MSGKISPITLNTEEKRTLENIASSLNTPYRKIERTRITLLAVEGITDTKIVQKIELQRFTVV